MAANLIDPNNHVPDVSPDDDWGDIADWHPSRYVSAGILPPKRKTVDAPTSKSSQSDDEGFRIGSHLPQRQDDPSADELEIHEITGSVVRLNPEPTGPARAERQVVFQERPAKRPLKTESAGEGTDWGRTQKHSIRWLLGAGIGVAAMIITGLLLLPVINDSNAPIPRPGDLSLKLDPEEASVEGIDALNRLVPLQPQAEQIFRTFASAKLADDFLPWIRHAKSLEALIRKTSCPAKISKNWLPSDNCTWNVFDSEGIPCAVFEGTLPDQSLFSACFVLESNRLLLDWKATIGYGTATFAELAESHGDGTEIRGWIIPTNFYTAIFPEADFQSYQLLSPDKGNTLWCYARKDAMVNMQLARFFPRGEIIQSSNEPVKVTLHLEHNRPESLPNQWLIGMVLHKEWISP
jgi:hypothetical protein